MDRSEFIHEVLGRFPSNLIHDGSKDVQKDWDYSVPSVDIWKECLRLLKPGHIS